MGKVSKLKYAIRSIGHSRRNGSRFERVRGTRPYIEALRDVHLILEPDVYLEIGVRHGSSLKLSRGAAIGIDPHPEIEMVPPNARLFECTSDDFFLRYANDALPNRVDLAFIDGMHLCEYVYRDFMNVEAYMSAAGVIVIDDVFPNHRLQARRKRCTRVWTGDVWKFGLLLQSERPDLTLTWLDTSPTGLLVVTTLDPQNCHLQTQYDRLVKSMRKDSGSRIPRSLLLRTEAVDPSQSNMRTAIQG